MKNVSESLAGRVGVLSLYSFSAAELEGRGSESFRPDKIAMEQGEMNITELFAKILRGSMPKVAVDPGVSIEDFYGSYMQTYLERDIRDMVTIKDESKFLRFISCVAARTGQELCKGLRSVCNGGSNV